ncbi:hypothetical protein KSP39_PZI020642 [Platanthera zijinensis]|uniref:Uncharacterized protein n=1 Tax=Platanthera zijinensis TaxID=2320716 RepID=A0AAP0B0R0_9ASPA
MSTRPVPRRESPWGLPEGETRQPRAHRCNDRAEDVIQASFEGNPFKTVPGPFKLFWRCMWSKPGSALGIAGERPSGARNRRRKAARGSESPEEGRPASEHVPTEETIRFPKPVREKAILRKLKLGGGEISEELQNSSRFLKSCC